MDSQRVTLLYAGEPHIELAEVAARTAALTGAAAEANDGVGARLIEHVGLAGPASPSGPRTALLGGQSTGAPSPETFADEVRQSWSTEDPARLFAGATYTVHLTELGGARLAASDRLRTFHGALRALVEHARPVGLVFEHSQQVVDPDEYLFECEASDDARPGFLNVRLFQQDAGALVMDTRGLEEIGLHDLQCHFRDLDPNDVGGVLLNLAYYIADRGAVVEDGDVVRGVERDSEWRCRFERSLVGPERRVLDLDPGPAHAAGERG